MTFIPITGCHRCQPEKWKQVGLSVGDYWCVKCKKIVKQILERRKKNDLCN